MITVSRHERLRFLGVAVSAAWAAAAFVAMTFGTEYDWPDFVHVNFGFPLTFATHTLNTIAGPVDRWSMDMGALGSDLAFWLAGLVVVVLVVEVMIGRSARRLKGE